MMKWAEEKGWDVGESEASVDSVRKWRRGRRLEARDTGDTGEAEVCSERQG